MDGVKVALGGRGMPVEADAGKIGRSGEPWCIFRCLSLKRQFSLDPAFFRYTLPRSGRLSPGQG